MNSYIKPPTLSTNFSESGKRAKKRFANILNTKAKKKGFLGFVLILLIVGITGVIFGFNYDKSISYVCKTFECSFDLPKSWEGKYEIEERNNNIVYVYHKAIRGEYGEGTGMLFYIEMLEGDNLTHDDITDPGNRTIALQESGYTYVFGMPTDVQYPIWDGGDKTLADDYVKMTKDHDKVKKNIRRATQINTMNTAIIIEDTDLFIDDEGKNAAIKLRKNDLVFVIYEQNNNFYYVQPAAMNIPLIEGYVSKKAISFDESLHKNANNGRVLSGTLYQSPNENDIYAKKFPYVFHIIKRQGEWSEINLPGGDDIKWVKTSDISYQLVPHTVDLSYINLQREVDNGHQPWRLAPLDVALDYVYNTLGKKGDEFEVFLIDSVTGSITYSFKKEDEKELQVVVYQPIKKDNSGIWAVHTGALIQNQIEDVIPTHRRIIVNSGMTWRIRLTDQMDFQNNEYGKDFNLEQEAKKVGINIYDYLGRDLDVFIYGTESEKGPILPYIFVFEGTNMIFYKDLGKQENEMIVRDMMITLHQHSDANE